MSCEAQIAPLRRIQADVVREADRRQLPTADGSRTLVEWVSSRCDIAIDTASRLERVAWSEHHFGTALDGGASFDRVAIAAGGDGHLHAELDLAGLERKAANRRRVTRRQESDVHARRHVVIQPDLFDTGWKLRGLLPAVEGALVSQVLDHVADRLPASPGTVAVSSTVVQAVTGCNPITSSLGAGVVTTPPPISPPCVGFVITS